jgi:hypothetical protein
MKQLSMFTTEDLPLFSGTSKRAAASPFVAKPQARQESLADCRFCADTGVLGDYAFCWCEAGQKALHRRQLINAAAGLSSGTIASLTGLTGYDEIEAIQARFVAFVSDRAAEFDTWQAAWEVFSRTTNETKGVSDE